MLLAAGAALGLTGCDAPVASESPIFLHGNAITPVGDSLFAVADPTLAAVILLDQAARPRDTLGLGVLTNPREIQATPTSYFVSDVEDGAPVLVELGLDGALRRRVMLDSLTEQPHQFAVLPDGALVIETPDQRLIALYGDSIATFAIVDRGARPSLLRAAEGGVVHAVPDRWITLYNSFGNIRWRIEWPWLETAFVSEVAIDRLGRVHVLAGVDPDGTFNVYTLTNTTGEVYRWYEGGREPSFVVDRLGAVTAAGERWTSRFTTDD